MSKQADITESMRTEQALRLTEFAVEVAAEAMFTVSPEGRILAANAIACERLEYTRDELLGMYISDIDPHYPHELWPEHFADLRKQGKVTFETQHRTKTGRILEVGVSVAYFEFEGEEYCCSSVLDLTEKKQSESLLHLQREVLALIASGGALRESLERLCGMVESMVPHTLASVMLLDETDGQLRFEAGPRLTDEMRGAFEPLEPGPESGSCGAAAYFKKTVFVEDTRTSPCWKNLQDIVVRFKLLACWSLPIFDEDGEVFGTFAISHGRPIGPDAYHRALLDTASNLASIAIRRKRYEKQLSLAQFSVEQSRTAVFWARSDGRFIEVNLAACDSLGYCREELLQMSVTQISNEVGEDRWARLVREIEEQGFFHIELNHRRKDGTEFPVDVLANTLSVEGEKFIVAFVQDITQRKDAQEELRRHRDELAHVSRLSTMGEMASNIAHELNQPLTAMVNYAYVMEKLLGNERVDLPRLRNFANSIREQAMRAGDIVSSMRSLAKKTAPSRSEADVNEVIRRALALLEPELRNSSVVLQETLSDSLPRIRVDSVQVQQVLVNLIRNAIDAMQSVAREKRELCVSTDLTDDKQIEIEVADSGCGISRQDHESIFETFHTTKPDGMGMGLGISRSIAEAHAGRLTVESSPGQGARFRFSLPLDAKERE